MPVTYTVPRPVVNCPHCSTLVDGWELKAGAVYTVPNGNPYGGDGHVVRDGDDADLPAPPGAAGAKAWPDGDVIRLQPCGDRVTREEMGVLMTQMRRQLAGAASVMPPSRRATWLEGGVEMEADVFRVPGGWMTTEGQTVEPGRLIALIPL